MNKPPIPQNANSSLSAYTNGQPPVMAGGLNFLSYVDLFGQVVNLKALIETEKTRRSEIEKEYSLKAQALMGEIKTMEAALSSDIRRREEFTTVALAQFEKLMDAGQHEVAMLIFDRVSASFKDSTLDDLFNYREKYASGGFIDMKIK